MYLYTWIQRRAGRAGLWCEVRKGSGIEAGSRWWPAGIQLGRAGVRSDPTRPDGSRIATCSQRDAVRAVDSVARTGRAAVKSNCCCLASCQRQERRNKSVWKFNRRRRRRRWKRPLMNRFKVLFRWFNLSYECVTRRKKRGETTNTLNERRMYEWIYNFIFAFLF